MQAHKRARLNPASVSIEKITPGLRPIFHFLFEFVVWRTRGWAKTFVAFRFFCYLLDGLLRNSKENCCLHLRLFSGHLDYGRSAETQEDQDDTLL